MLQALTPGEDSTTNGVIIEDTTSNSAPDLTQYDSIVMDVRDSKKNLIAEYEVGSGSHIPYSFPNQSSRIDAVIDANDGRTQTNKLNQINFDLYGEDTKNAAPGEVYANVYLIKNNVQNYPTQYDIIVPFLVFGKFTKPVK
jgi:hypothetical protein